MPYPSSSTWPGATLYPGVQSSDGENAVPEVDPWFYVGVFGRMQRFPDRLAPVSAPLSRIGGTHTSLTGARTVDTFGYKRSWSWTWDMLLPWHLPLVESLQYGLMPGPLRLIDPRRANRLPEQIASGGSLRRSTRGFTVTAGDLSYQAVYDAPPNATSLPTSGILRGSQRWDLLSPGGGILSTMADNDLAFRVPVLAGQSLELSAWVAGSPNVPLRISWVEYSGDGSFTVRVGAITTPSLTSWQRAVVTFVPNPSTVAVAPRLVATSLAAAGSVSTTAWQLAVPGGQQPPTRLDACDEVDMTGMWWPGGGAPLVVAEPGDHSYSYAWAHNVALTLVEV